MSIFEDFIIAVKLNLLSARSGVMIRHWKDSKSKFQKCSVPVYQHSNASDIVQNQGTHWTISPQTWICSNYCGDCNAFPMKTRAIGTQELRSTLWAIPFLPFCRQPGQDIIPQIG